MSEPGLSKRARKKQARETQPQASRSESVTSDAAKRDDPTTLAQAALDPDYKPKEGANPFIDVVQKKVRNLTKRRVHHDLGTWLI
jgi:hypothetical protein